MMNVREAIEAKGIAITEATVTMIPDNTVKIEGKPAETLMSSSARSRTSTT